MDKDIRRRLLKIYLHMKERCYDQNDKRYADWGGRGIHICDEWLNDREKFFEWSIKNGYSIGLSIDRKDNNKDYSPENCRWVTLKENNQNRRNSIFYTIDGETKNLQQWCDEYGVSRSMVNRRLSLGWDILDALKTPKRERDTTSMIGRRYGRLTVLEFSHSDSKRKTWYKCLCDCGNYTTVEAQKLKSGHTSSCGCLKKEMYEENRKKFKQIWEKK